MSEDRGFSQRKVDSHILPGPETKDIFRCNFPVHILEVGLGSDGVNGSGWWVRPQMKESAQ